jgi:hypothetical protein
MLPVSPSATLVSTTCLLRRQKPQDHLSPPSPGRRAMIELHLFYPAQVVQKIVIPSPSLTVQ